MSARPLRVLVMSHMDPRLSRGGAEIAAFGLFGALRATSGVEARFLAAAPGRLPERLGARIVERFGAGEHAYRGEGYDHFLHANPDAGFPPEFAALLEEFRPDAVHLHHYAHFGVETLAQIRRALPAARIVLTLHEFLAICHHHGQMVKRPDHALCHAASPADCHRCFPEIPEREFFLRERFIRRFLAEADWFVAPSRFLARRYQEWGLPAARLRVIENGMPEAPPAAPPPRRAGLRVGFFGQVSPLKGVDVLVEAALILARDGARDGVEGLSIAVHGDASAQPEPLRRAAEASLARAPGLLRFHGPYDNRRVGELMRGVDAVVVPSVWWENSPLVIQEALLHRRPVLCSDIGGMGEKVRDGEDGFHFRAGDPHALAALLRDLVRRPQRLRRLQATLARPPSLAETAAATLALYREAPPRAPCHASGHLR